MTMGSNQQYITTKEAAAMLGTSVAVVYWYVRKGMLKSHTKQYNTKSKRKHQFVRADIELLLAVKADRRGNTEPIAEAMLRATRAEAKCHELELRLNGLFDLMGSPYRVLDMSEDGIRTTYAMAANVRDDAAGLTVENAVQLAYAVYHIGEEYLTAVERVAKDPEPWVVFLQAIQHAVLQLRGNDDAAARAAHAYLCMAKRQLRDVSFEYVRRAHGFRAAERLAEQDPDRTDAIICGILLHTIQGIWNKRLNPDR